ncbi:YheC/YheD family protein [Bacillus sp. FJAT-29790]|uniref:YheC/YheD family endospore coat-associated protein n=1 Tax=Bacillus sp. FJAT-29790 TaxID=1895002 RepID=UPI001C22C10A|nr:YheC/YheD family protein [Bacillus sp. FJAT-29790]MBU8879970.1 YheC/YheD family protein [Bacillus sp. FJAT-29790]
MIRYEIKPENSNDPYICMDENTAETIGIVNNERISISYGKRRIESVVYVNKLRDRNTIQVSDCIIQKLLMDTKVKYEISFKNSELIIGPLIGILLGKSEQKLTENLDRYLTYTLAYKQINGVLFVFSEDQIDFANDQITGYVYDHESPDHWRRVKLPFPGAIFRRIELSNKTLQDLTSKMDRRFFNSHYFDKWEFWNLFSQNEELRVYLPETTKQINRDSLDAFLEKYNGVYLKPKSGSRGKGIHFIEKKDQYYQMIKNYDDEVRCMSETEMTKFLSNHSYYLLQQPIRLHAFEDRMVDYRVILQKNETGYWHCTGMIARFGKTNAISSNFKANGFAKEGIEALKMQFGYDELKAFQKYQEIIRVCCKLAYQIERDVGAYADFGIDIGIDEQEKIWIIEVNKRPDHDFPLMIKDRKMYYNVKANPILYAKHVAMSSLS